MIWPILEARAETKKYLYSFLVQMKKSKSHSEIIWPQVFWPKISILKGNHSVLKSCYELGIILENQVFWKLNLASNVNDKKFIAELVLFENIKKNKNI